MSLRRLGARYLARPLGFTSEAGVSRATARVRCGIFAALGLGVTGLLAGWVLSSEARVQAAEHPIEWDGHRWSQFSPQEKGAFLGGFLAGAAASQAYGVVLEDTVFDSEALAERVARLRSEAALNFPFATNIYHARLHDYYFYIDRRERPIYRAIAELNFQLQTKHY